MLTHYHERCSELSETIDEGKHCSDAMNIVQNSDQEQIVDTNNTITSHQIGSQIITGITIANIHLYVLSVNLENTESNTFLFLENRLEQVTEQRH